MSDSPHEVYWKNSIQLTPVYSLKGYSRAAQNTGFYCPELDLALDAGLEMNEKPAVICLTHLHTDHFCNLNKMLLGTSKNPIIIIPDNDKFEYMLTETLRMLYLSSKCIHPLSDLGKDPKRKYPYRLVRLQVGNSFQIKDFNKKKGEGIYVEGLPSDHGVISISFGFYELRTRCKPEYQGLQNSEYKELKKKGIEFTELYKSNIFCYMSDTNYTPFVGPQAELILQYPKIITECTFILPEDIPHANKKKHIHWEQIRTIVKENYGNQFILIHFSRKYEWNEVETFFRDYFKKNGTIQNVVLWIHTGIVDYGKSTNKN